MKFIAILILLGISFAGETQQLELWVDKMTCSACVFTVKKAIEKVKGVEDVKVSLKPPIARVKFDPNLVSPNDLVKSTKKYGYPSSIFLEMDPSNLPDSVIKLSGIEVINDKKHKLAGIRVNPSKVELKSLLKLIKDKKIGEGD